MIFLKESESKELSLFFFIIIIVNSKAAGKAAIHNSQVNVNSIRQISVKNL